MPEPHRKIIVLPDAESLARAAADRLGALFGRQTDRLTVCLSGGSTPVRLYRLLATDRYRDGLPWDRVQWFWGDERLVPPDDPRSNFGAARQALLDRVSAPSANIHPVPTEGINADDAAKLYESELHHFYGASTIDPQRPLFDAVFLGLGVDGHTASLFPGHEEFRNSVRWVLPVPQSALEPFVPRVTLTLPILASSRETIFLVSGADKREAMRRVIAGQDLPATRAYSNGSLIWLVDHDAVPELSDVD